MPEKTPGGPLPKPTGTTQKQGAPGKPAQPVQTNPGFKGGGGKGGGKK